MSKTKINSPLIGSIDYIDFLTNATPAIPAAGVARLYNGSNKELYFKDSGGAITKVFPNTHTLSFTFYNGGNVLQVGDKIAFYTDFTIAYIQWTLGSVDGTSGSITLDIWSNTHANFPPVVGDSITASAKPNISSAIKGQSSTLTGWTNQLSAGYWHIINIDSVTNIKHLSVNLQYTKS
ncbi:MAG: hypothetical protein ABI851_12050 [Saprospiraceae bacterium]